VRIVLSVVLQVALCQFVRLHQDMSKQVLVDLAQRHCGCGFQEGQVGADFGVPIFAKDPSMLLVQVKNLRSDPAANKNSDHICQMLLPSEAFAYSEVVKSELPKWDQGCVRVYMQLGAASPSATCRSVSDGGARPLQLFGLGARCLPDDVRDRLSLLLHGRVDLESYLEQLDMANLQPRPGHLDLLRDAWPFVIASNVDYKSK